MSKALLIKDFPMGVSINLAYRNIPGRGRCVSKELTAYKKECALWAMSNGKAKQAFYDLIKEEEADTFKIDFYFVFKHERLWTKDGRPKRLDASNFIKTTEDQLCEFLGIDDRHFFNISAEKIEGEKEGCIILISAIRPMHSLELLEALEKTSENQTLAIN